MSGVALTMPLRARPLVRFLRFVWPHRWLIAGAAVAGVVKFLIPLLFPLALKYVTDVVLSPHPEALGETTNRLWERWCAAVLGAAPWLGSGGAGRLAVVGGTLLALYVVLGVASFLRVFWIGQAGHRLVFDLRATLFEHVQRLSHAFFDARRSGGLAARLIGDVQMAQTFVGSVLTNVWMDAAALGFVVGVLFVLERRLAVVAVAVMPVYVLLVRFFGPRIKAASREARARLEEVAGDAQERIAAIGTVKAFGQEALEAGRFRRRGGELLEHTLRTVRLSSAQQAATTVLTTAAPLLVVWAAGVLILQGAMGVGTMIAFYAYLGSLYVPLQRFSELGIVVSHSLAAMERIFELFDTHPEVADAPGARPLPRVRGRVTFRAVTFVYPGRHDGRPALAGVDLDVAPGETIALVGRSGAGKSTLMALVPRFYDVSAGAVLVDGHDVRSVTLASLRAQIGIVPQDPVLFSGTLEENIRYGRPDAPAAAVRAAARAAHAAEFIERLPDGYRTVVGERGLRLSGGQRQRIAIARAFLRDAPILILDEATAAVDAGSERLIHAALGRLMEGRTTFIIAHRLTSLAHADRIVVLDEGRVCEAGRHDELLARGGAYARLFAGQVRAAGGGRHAPAAAPAALGLRR